MFSLSLVCDMYLFPAVCVANTEMLLDWKRLGRGQKPFSDLYILFHSTLFPLSTFLNMQLPFKSFSIAYPCCSSYWLHARDYPKKGRVRNTYQIFSWCKYLLLYWSFTEADKATLIYSTWGSRPNHAQYSQAEWHWNPDVSGCALIWIENYFMRSEDIMTWAKST